MKELSIKPLTYRHGRTKHPKFLINLIGLAYQGGNVKLTEIAEGLGLSYRTLKYWKSRSFYLYEFDSVRKGAEKQRVFPKLVLKRVRELYREAGLK